MYSNRPRHERFDDLGAIVGMTFQFALLSNHFRWICSLGAKDVAISRQRDRTNSCERP